MTDETKIVLRGEKSAGVIMSLCELYDLPTDKATDIFFRSETAAMIEDNVADLHCRSNKYLATLVMEEHRGGLG